MQQRTVMKFGGSSVATAERIQNVATIVAQDKTEQTVVVVSAMQGVTDLLIAALEAAYDGKAKLSDQHLAAVYDTHMQAITALNLHKSATVVQEQVDVLQTELRGLLDTVTPHAAYSKQLYDHVVSFGERTSVVLVAAALEANGVTAQPVEATRLIVTNDRFGDAEPLLDASTKKTSAVLKPLLKKGVVPVVTGFIGATTTGALTTLGRGGSDYTSTILGYCLDADAVTIWTDVTGVMTADPRVISDAQTIAELSYEEAAELSFYGAKVLHPLTMLPASQKNIPIYIKNTFEPSAAGTRIYSHRVHTSGVVKAITTLNGLSMITVRGTGEVSPVYLPKIIDALLRQNIDILVLIQSSSDHNTVLMVRSYVAEEAADCIINTLVGKSGTTRKDLVHVEQDISIVAVVGAGIHTMPGMVAEVFSALAVSGVEAHAIAYGSSKHNLSFAIKTSDTHNAVHSLHQAFQLIEGGN